MYYDPYTPRRHGCLGGLLRYVALLAVRLALFAVIVCAIVYLVGLYVPAVGAFTSEMLRRAQAMLAEWRFGQ